MNESIKTSAEALEAEALPKRYEAHKDTGAEKDLPTAVNSKPIAQKSPAAWAYERIILYIQNFEKQLDNAHEVAMGFAGGDVGVLRIEGMGYFDPDIITFHGTDEHGAKTQLVQHVSQLNVMLRALPKPKEVVEPTRIGFRLAQDLQENG